MGVSTGITWCDHTFNPFIGCQKVSPACHHCYAEVSSPVNVSRKIGLELWGPAENGAVRRVASDRMWQQPRYWNAQAEKAGQRRRVFCASLADVFEHFEGKIVSHDGTHRVELTLDILRRQLFAMIDETPWLDWLLLTKRPQNIGPKMPKTKDGSIRRNVWLGTTAENQRYLDLRVPQLVRNKAVLHFVSIEPMLQRISLGQHAHGLGWVIVGGESGSDCRPLHPWWVHILRQECNNYGIPFHFKQWGGWQPHQGTESPREPLIPRNYYEIPERYRKIRLDGQDKHSESTVVFLKAGKDRAGHLLNVVGKLQAIQEIPEPRLTATN